MDTNRDSLYTGIISLRGSCDALERDVLSEREHTEKRAKAEVLDTVTAGREGIFVKNRESVKANGGESPNGTRGPIPTMVEQTHANISFPLSTTGKPVKNPLHSCLGPLKSECHQIKEHWTFPHHWLVMMLLFSLWSQLTQPKTRKQARRGGGGAGRAWGRKTLWRKPLVLAYKAEMASPKIRRDWRKLFCFLSFFSLNSLAPQLPINPWQEQRRSKSGWE